MHLREVANAGGAVDADPAGLAVGRRRAAERRVVAQQVEALAQRRIVVQPQHGLRGAQRLVQGQDVGGGVAQQAVQHQQALLRQLRGQGAQGGRESGGIKVADLRAVQDEAKE